MAVYGDMLTFFSEQKRIFSYYTMNPKVKAGYTARKFIKVVVGIFQYMKRGDLIRENETEPDVEVPTLWTRDKLSHLNGFITKDGELYRITGRNDWDFEAGFNVYMLELFTGSSDEQKPHEYVDIGQNSYL